jgi:SAM-dependent methyltransferase
MDESLYHKFYQQEEDHWWFAARSAIVQRIIRSYGNVQPGETVLDIGCGTGAILKALSATYDVVGLDTSPLAIEYSRKRGLTNMLQMPVHEFPKERFNVRTAILLDVIEHIDDDVAVLAAARRIVEPEGRVIVTVPAHMWLWNAHDVVNQHKRRYSKASLKAAIDRAGLDTVRITFYNTLLFPMVAAKKLMDRARSATVSHVSDTLPNPALNSVLKTIFASERYLLPSINLPFGISLLAVAKPRSLQK